jgi:hypothetical protein
MLNVCLASSDLCTHAMLHMYAVLHMHAVLQMHAVLPVHAVLQMHAVLGTPGRLVLLRPQVDATLQCTGNRCNELEPTAAGGIGQIGNACWQGVRVRDLIMAEAPTATAEATVERAAANAAPGQRSHEAHWQLEHRMHKAHLHAVGSDGYEISIPMCKARAQCSE